MPRNRAAFPRTVHEFHQKSRHSLRCVYMKICMCHPPDHFWADEAHGEGLAGKRKKHSIMIGPLKKHDGRRAQKPKKERSRIETAKSS